MCPPIDPILPLGNDAREMVGRAGGVQRVTRRREREPGEQTDEQRRERREEAYEQARESAAAAQVDTGAYDDHGRTHPDEAPTRHINLSA